MASRLSSWARTRAPSSSSPTGRGAELSEDERATFDAWLDSTVRGESLYLLLRYATRRARRGSKSSSQVFAAVLEQSAPAELEQLRAQLEEVTAERDRLARVVELRRRSDER